MSSPLTNQLTETPSSWSCVVDDIDAAAVHSYRNNNVNTNEDDNIDEKASDINDMKDNNDKNNNDNTKLDDKDATAVRPRW